MFSRLRLMVLSGLFAALGAVSGHIVAEVRRQQESAESPHLDLNHINVRPRDIAPGVVAAMRVSGRPWSWLHVPPWLAAFGVNFAIAAFAREISSVTGNTMEEAGPVQPEEVHQTSNFASSEFTDDIDSRDNTGESLEGLRDSRPTDPGEFTAFRA